MRVCLAGAVFVRDRSGRRDRSWRVQPSLLYANIWILSFFVRVLREHIEHTHRRDARTTEKKAISHVILIGTVPLYRFLLDWFGVWGGYD